jgi:ketosteroid isomerase-like protein
MLRAAYEAFNRGDFDAAVELVRPDVEFIRPGLEAPLRGASAIREWMEPDAFEKQQIEPLDFEVNGDRVLTRQHMRARGAGSGIELDVETWVVFTFDDGLVARGEVYPLNQEEEARRAAGLGE